MALRACAPGVTKAFGIATECGMARARTRRMIDDLLRVHEETSQERLIERAMR